jgi:hypothetical protein
MREEGFAQIRAQMFVAVTNAPPNLKRGEAEYIPNLSPDGETALN